MSELTQCNYCSLREIQNRARSSEMKVTLLSDAKWGMGGVNVYVHPKEILIKDLPDGENGERRKYRVAWFMEVGTACSC